MTDRADERSNWAAYSPRQMSAQNLLAVCSSPDSAAAEYKLSRPEVAAWKLAGSDGIAAGAAAGVPASAAVAAAAADHCCAASGPAPRTVAPAPR